MNPLLIVFLCLLIFSAGIIAGIVFVGAAEGRDAERIDYLEERAQISNRIEVVARGDYVGLVTFASGVWRRTLREAIDASKSGGPAVVESADAVESRPFTEAASRVPST